MMILARNNPMRPGRGRTFTGKLLACCLFVLNAAHLPGEAFAADRADESVQGRGGLLLIAAVKEGRTDLVQRLVNDGADVNSTVNREGTPLIAACRTGDLTMVDELLRLGADVNRPTLGDGNPLIAASINGNLSVVQRLVEAGANVNAIVTTDETPLINASRAGKLQVVRYLVDRGADINLGVTADNGQWRSPLNQARAKAIRDYLISKGARP